MNIASDKLFAHIGRVAGDRRPITADIFLTNYCNNRCSYCTYNRWTTPGAGRKAMAYEEFVIYASRLRALGVSGMILTGGGEPTICPDFPRITRWLEQEGIHYGVNTNLNQPVECSPDYLKVSLDGYDEDSYEQSRGVRRYEQVCRNIQEFAKWKRVHSPETTLGIQRVATSAEDVVRFYEANKRLDVDYISFRPVESTGGEYYASETERERAEEIRWVLEGLMHDDSRVIANFKWGLLGVREDDCAAQWAQIAINERGEVMYCCHKPYQIVGHVMDPDILEAKARVGTNMSMCDVPCRMTAPNRFVAETRRARKDACFI